MAERITPNQRPDQSQNPNSMYKRPPSAGGPTRVPEEQEPARAPGQRPSLGKKALRYLPVIATIPPAAAATYFFLS